MTAIASIQLQPLDPLLEIQSIRLAFDDSAKTWLTERRYNPIYSERPLKCVIQQKFQNTLAQKTLAGEILD